jgi:predicted outer membrane protein
MVIATSCDLDTSAEWAAKLALRSLRGRAFDLEVRKYMVSDHHKDIAKFKAQALSGDRPAALAREEGIKEIMHRC